MTASMGAAVGRALAKVLDRVLTPTPTAPALILYADSSRPDDSGDGRSWATAKRTLAGAKAAAGTATPVELWIRGRFRELGTWGTGEWHVRGDVAGAIVSGADTGHVWKAESALGPTMWSTPWTYNWGYGADPWAGVAAMNPLLRRREDVFVGVTADSARRLWQVASLEECRRNGWTFYAQDDATTGRLYVNLPGGMDGRIIELAVRDACIRLHTAGSVRDVTVEKGAHEFHNASHANLRVQGYKRQVIERVTSRYGSGFGIQLSDTNASLKGVVVEWGGVQGLSAYKQYDAVNEDVELRWNNERGWRNDFIGWASGNKQSSMRRDTWRRLRAHRNFGGGFWFDIDVADQTLEDCDFAWNIRFGTWTELAQGPVVHRRCRAWGNGMGGFRMNADRLYYHFCAAWNNRKGNWDNNGTYRRSFVPHEGPFAGQTYYVENHPIVNQDGWNWQDEITQDMPLVRNIYTGTAWTTMRAAWTWARNQYGTRGATATTKGWHDGDGRLAYFKDLVGWQGSSTTDEASTIANSLDVPLYSYADQVAVEVDDQDYAAAVRAEVKLSNSAGMTPWERTESLTPAPLPTPLGEVMLTQAEIVASADLWSGVGTGFKTRQEPGVMTCAVDSGVTKVDGAFHFIEGTNGGVTIPAGEFADRDLGRFLVALHFRRYGVPTSWRPVWSSESSTDCGFVASMGPGGFNTSGGASSVDRVIAPTVPLPPQDEWVTAAVVVKDGTLALWTSWAPMAAVVNLAPVVGPVVCNPQRQRLCSRAHTASPTAASPVDIRAYARFTDLRASGGTDGWSSSLPLMMSLVHEHWSTRTWG